MAQQKVKEAISRIWQSETTDFLKSLEQQLILQLSQPESSLKLLWVKKKNWMPSMNSKPAPEVTNRPDKTDNLHKIFTI